MGYNHLLADRTRAMDVNVIREILKVVSQPGMVSLAGGIPAPKSFPMEIMRDLTAIVIDKYGSSAFQYDPTEGFDFVTHVRDNAIHSKLGPQDCCGRIDTDNRSFFPWMRRSLINRCCERS